MKHPKSTPVLLLVAVIYLVGAVGLSMEASQPIFQKLTPLNLLLMAGILFFHHQPWNKKHGLAFLLILLAGFFIEVAGVQSGLVFGQYQYGETLGYQIMGTPLIIGVNWLMLTYMAYHITQIYGMKFLPQLITGAFLLLTYDLLLEPVAIQLDFWSWGGAGIPIQNYLAWWLIAAIFIAFWRSLKIQTSNSVASGLFIIQLSFFLILNFIL